jgi:hypothetical protein
MFWYAPPPKRGERPTLLEGSPAPLFACIVVKTLSVNLKC